MAGIAAAWLILTEIRSPPSPALFPAVFLFAVALAFDLLQYVVPPLLFWSIERREERKSDRDDSIVAVRAWVALPSLIFFTAKCFLVFAGYVAFSVGLYTLWRSGAWIH
jgi:nitroreductase